MVEEQLTLIHHVPNVPCGVESSLVKEFGLVVILVPNVPCGVERFLCLLYYVLIHLVPNVPCGVESYQRMNQPHRLSRS